MKGIEDKSLDIAIIKDILRQQTLKRGVEDYPGQQQNDIDYAKSKNEANNIAKKSGKRNRFGGKKNSAMYVCYVLVILLFTGLLREYVRILELKMLLQNCASEKHSINSQMDILYDQRMSLKSLIDREREINQKSQSEWNAKEGTLTAKSKKCDEDLTKERERSKVVIKQRTDERKMWQIDKKKSRDTLAAKYQAELNNKTMALGSSLQRYKVDARSLKDKLNSCSGKETASQKIIDELGKKILALETKLNDQITGIVAQNKETDVNNQEENII